MSGRPVILVEAVPDRESQEAAPVPGSAVDVLARTLWGEARRETVRAKEGLAATVMNRVARARTRTSGYWWGGDVESVCRRPGQFPSWTGEAERLRAVTVADRAFRVCVRVARRAVGGRLADPTDGATHLHRLGDHPPWARGRVPSAVLGPFLFYNDVE